MKTLNEKAPMSKESIYKLMLILVYIVAPVYLIKNLIGGVASGAAIIGVCLGVFAVIVFMMKKTNAPAERKQMVVSVSLVVLVFLISLSSGQYYSDDYCLYMAVMGVSGLYMEPKVTRAQLLITPVLLIFQFILHPEKVESTGQFITCLVVFILAAAIMYLLVNRGKAFIQVSEARAEEAEKLMTSMKDVGEELQKGMRTTVARYEELEEVNAHLVKETDGLRRGSLGISQGTQDVVASCDDVRDRIHATEQQIGSLNAEVNGCETAIKESSVSLEEMSQQMATVQKAMTSTNDVFATLEGQMSEIFEVLEEMNKIASSTTMLALNASIEAARAGKSGAGFAVVASKVQDLAIDSTECSKKVDAVLRLMQEQVNETTTQLQESTQAVDGSLDSLKELQNKFGSLTERFDKLYHDIDEQNDNIQGVEQIFGELKDKISEMSDHSEENRDAVESISEAMDKYKENLQLVIEDTKSVSRISENMLKTAIEG
ncbi:MAG: hypothetical protein IJ324_07410 [Lachnospiraceae bacterium]|nr:hypothetical protein [Lachnospiraceae bacterium]